MTISSSSTLRVIGMNPARFRVTGLVTIAGVLDVTGGDGDLAGGGGAAGAAGFDGGDGGIGGQFCPFTGGSCTSFDSYLNGCAQAPSRQYPSTLKGEGPGRGHQGGETYLYYAQQSSQRNITGTGGGGGGHATAGEDGEDRANVGWQPMAPRVPACGVAVARAQLERHRRSRRGRQRRTATVRSSTNLAGGSGWRRRWLQPPVPVRRHGRHRWWRRWRWRCRRDHLGGPDQRDRRNDGRVGWRRRQGQASCRAACAPAGTRQRVVAAAAPAAASR